MCVRATHRGYIHVQDVLGERHTSNNLHVHDQHTEVMIDQSG